MAFAEKVVAGAAVGRRGGICLCSLIGFSRPHVI